VSVIVFEPTTYSWPGWAAGGPVGYCLVDHVLESRGVLPIQEHTILNAILEPAVAVGAIFQSHSSSEVAVILSLKRSSTIRALRHASQASSNHEGIARGGDFRAGSSQWLKSRPVEQQRHPALVSSGVN